MRLIAVKDYDICNYKKPSMFLIFPYCNFKCDSEFGTQICQNWSLILTPSFDITPKEIYTNYYLNSPFTHAIVCGGLEPLDSFEELIDFIDFFRRNTTDDIVIYTGYNKSEIPEKLERLKQYPNILMKFGRFIPDQDPHFDEVLGVNLASPNQYAEWIS